MPEEYRARLLFWGIVAALVLRGLAILGGVALIEQFHFVIYVLGVLLLVLAWRILKGVAENVDPDKNFVVRAVRRFFPVTGEYHGAHWFVKIDHKRYVTPLFLCLAAIVAADIAFAVDSIPAAFAITRDSVLIWMGNVFALLGMRALFVLVEGLIKRFRYLDETIAVVLALVAVKLLIEDLYKMGPVLSLVVVAVCFAVGITASLIADARDPDAEEKQAERAPASPSRSARNTSLRGASPPSSGSGSGSSSSSSSTTSSSSASRFVGRHRPDLQALEQLVALRVVERDLVADEDPVAVVDVVGELRARVGGVVDDDQDLGLGVEVRPRASGELIQVEAAKTGHTANL